MHKHKKHKNTAKAYLRKHKHINLTTALTCKGNTGRDWLIG